MSTLTTNDMLAIVALMQMGLKTLDGAEFDRALSVYTGIHAKFARMQQEQNAKSETVSASEEKSAAG